MKQLEHNENKCKLLARLILLNVTTKLTLPTQEEWIGLNLLERDDELPRIKSKNRTSRND